MAGNTKGRPAAPKCSCGKSMYKRMDKGNVLPEDSYAWCRNQDCSKYNIAQKNSRFRSIAQTKVEPVKEAPKYSEKRASKRARPASERKVEKPSEPKEETKAQAHDRLVADEPEAVKTARKYIKEAIESVSQKFSHNVIGLSLAIVAQETGSFDAANELVDYYNLQELYGIQKRLTSNPKKN